MTTREKGEITRAKINDLSSEGQHDIFFPMDCDEFVVTLCGRGLSCSKNDVLAQIEPLVETKGVMIFPILLHNIPGDPSAFYFKDMPKVCFSGGGVSHLEHGNHDGGMPGFTHRYVQSLTYLHFHNRSFVTLQDRALEKLKNRVDVHDREKLLAYKGHGDHLIPYFTMTESDYVMSFVKRDIVRFSEFVALLTALGAYDGLRRATHSDVAIERTGDEFSSQFDGEAYWRVHRDVAERETPALFHYCRHGKREGRQLQ